LGFVGKMIKKYLYILKINIMNFEKKVKIFLILLIIPKNKNPILNFTLLLEKQHLTWIKYAIGRLL